MKLCHINCRSVCNKASEVSDIIKDHDVDLCALGETWLKGDDRDKPVVAELLPDGFKIEHMARAKRGGGVALVFREHISVAQKRRSNWESFEYMECLVQTNVPLRLVIVYRPPHHGNSFNTFINDFTAYLEQLIVTNGQLLITGDFNIHLDGSSKECSDFMVLLRSFGLIQHVRVPTHTAGHTLDLLITKCDNIMKPSVMVFDQCISDHYTLICCLALGKPIPQPRCITYRSIKRINVDALKNDISSSFNYSDDPDIDSCVMTYNSTLRSLMDKHAPLKTRVVPMRKETKWFNDDIRCAKKKLQATGASVAEIYSAI